MSTLQPRSRPDWTQEVDAESVAVRATIAGKLHDPDLTSEEPAPACGASPAGSNWQAVPDDPQAEHCMHQSCRGPPSDRLSQDSPTPERARKAAADRRQRDLGWWSE